MRIAIVIKTFPPDVIGGMETQTQQMATELNQAGHDVTVFTKYFDQQDDDNVPYKIIGIRNWKFHPFISDLTFLIFTLFALLRRHNKFDVLQCMMIYPVGFMGLIANKITNIPYFAWIRGGDYYLMNDTWWKRKMMRCVLTDTLVLAQSKEIREDITSDFSDIDCNIKLLGNAVSVPKETASGDGVLYVGRLATKKGLEYLIDAMSEINVPLTIVGDGPERNDLESLAANTNANVTFVGEVPPNEVDQYYRNAAVFVLPSIEGEGMPNAVLEAMSWGLPVVATDSGSLQTIINDGKTGYIVPMRDSNALRIKISNLIEDEQECKMMGASARQYVQKNHSWNWLIDSISSIYVEISNKNNCR